jgi:hypothetical protein
MKSKLFLLIIACHFQQIISAQNIGINATGAAPDKSAMLDVSSTDKGMLVPRMTSAQRTAIELPAGGLLVYQTDSPAGFYFYDGALWNLLINEINGKYNFNFKGSIAQGFNQNVYAKVTYDVQNYLNNVTFANSTFTAPSSGIYSFSANINAYGNSATSAGLGFFVNNVSRSSATFNITANVFQNLGYTDNLLLDKGDQVTVQIRPALYISGFAVSFTGFKIN